MTGLKKKAMKYAIQSIPIPFHDLVEIFEYLINLPPVYLWQHQGLNILVNNIPRLKILILYKNGLHCVTYTTIRTPHCLTQ